MAGVAWTFAVIAGLAHVGAFVAESLLFHRPGVQRLMIGRVDPAPGVRLWAFNQGFYNLFLALGAFAGVVMWAAFDETTAGRTLIVFCCAAMALAASVARAARPTAGPSRSWANRASAAPEGPLGHDQQDATRPADR